MQFKMSMVKRWFHVHLVREDAKREEVIVSFYKVHLNDLSSTIARCLHHPEWKQGETCIRIDEAEIVEIETR